MPDDYTDAQLADGTTLRFKGTLNPDQLRAKVADFRAKQVAPQMDRPAYDLSPYSEARSYTYPPRAPVPNVDMKAPITPQSVARSAGQGLLDIPRGIASQGEALAYPEKSIGEPGERYRALAHEQLTRGNPLGLVNALSGVLAPTTIPQQAQSFTQTAMDDPSRAAGQVAGMVALGKIGDISPTDTMKSAVRYVAGAGEAPADLAARVSAEKGAQTVSDYNQKVSNVLSDNQERIAQARQARQQQIADIQSDNQRATQNYQAKVAQVRQVNAQAQAAVAQGASSEQAAQQMTHTVSAVLPDFANAIEKQAHAAYPEIEGTVDRSEINAAMRKVVDDKLLGAGNVPASIARIIDSTSPEGGKSTGPRIGGRTLDLSVPDDLKSYQRLKAQNAFTPQEIQRIEGGGGDALTHTDLHGMYSELGREAYGRDLPGDSKAALTQARTVLLDKMQKLADAENKGTQFKAAQRGWQVFENVFRNSDAPALGGSPIARALRARDPITGQLRADYVRQILTDNKGYRTAQQLLSNYGARDLQASLQLLKESADTAKAAPKVARLKAEPIAPTPKEIPPMGRVNLKDLPKPAQTEPFDIQKFRESQMEKYAIESQKLRPFNFMPWRLPYTAIQQVLSKVLTNPAARKAIAK